MSVVESLRRLELRAGKLLKDVISEANEKGATLILFGSRARGDHSLISDYDLLAVGSGEPIGGRGLNVNVANVKLENLEEEAHTSPVVLAAILEGTVLSDPLKIEREIVELRSRLIRLGGKVEPGRIVMPGGSEARQPSRDVLRHNEAR